MSGKNFSLALERSFLITLARTQQRGSSFALLDNFQFPILMKLQDAIALFSRESSGNEKLRLPASCCFL